MRRSIVGLILIALVQLLLVGFSLVYLGTLTEHTYRSGVEVQRVLDAFEKTDDPKEKMVLIDEPGPILHEANLSKLKVYAALTFACIANLALLLCLVLKFRRWGLEPGPQNGASVLAMGPEGFGGDNHPETNETKEKNPQCRVQGESRLGSPQGRQDDQSDRPGGGRAARAGERLEKGTPGGLAQP